MKADATWLKDAINNSKGSRSLQAIEVYQQQNKEKIEECVKAEIAQQGAKTKKERMSIHRRVFAEMWDEEDGGIVAKIHEEADKQKKERQRNNVSGKYIFGRSGEEQTPEEYNKWVACCWLVAVLTDDFEELLKPFP